MSSRPWKKPHARSEPGSNAGRKRKGGIRAALTSHSGSFRQATPAETFRAFMNTFLPCPPSGGTFPLECPGNEAQGKQNDAQQDLHPDVHCDSSFLCLLGYGCSHSPNFTTSGKDDGRHVSGNTPETSRLFKILPPPIFIPPQSPHGFSKTRPFPIPCTHASTRLLAPSGIQCARKCCSTQVLSEGGRAEYVADARSGLGRLRRIGLSAFHLWRRENTAAAGGGSGRGCLGESDAMRAIPS